MQMSLVLALGVAKAAMATEMFMNGTNPAPVASPVAAPAAAPVEELPKQVGEFELLGCTDKPAIAKFTMMGQEKMSANLCAASCGDAKYFAMDANEACHCGEDAPPGVDKGACAAGPAPAAASPSAAAAAGAAAAAPLNRRGYDMCTIYVRSSESKVETKYEVHVHTITACPATVTDCPTKPHVTTVTKTYTTEVCPAPEWHKKKIICYGPNCAPEYPCEGKDCKHERVICKGDYCWTEECRDDEDWSKLVIYKSDDDCHYADTCWGDDCDKKIVCYDGKCIVEKCYGDECKKNLVCNGDDCRYVKCDDDYKYCHNKVVCQAGKDCKVVEVCKDDNKYTCPKPPMPNWKPQPKPTGVPVPNYNKECKGDDCDKYNKGWNKECNGYDCDKYNKGWNKECNGYDCHKPAPGGTASSSYGPRPTMPPMVGGAERNAVGVVGALAGIALLL